MMDPFTFDGHTYTAEDITALRSEVIKWRDDAMKQWPEAIDFTVTASHLIAFLTHVLEQAERIVNMLCDQAKEEGLYD